NLGADETGAARRVQLPVASGAPLTAALLVFIDVLKELPATIILRPFGFDTLAVIADRSAKDERLHQAAWPSLMIVVVAIPAVIWLTRRVAASRPGARTCPRPSPSPARSAATATRSPSTRPAWRCRPAASPACWALPAAARAPCCASLPGSSRWT